jgi:hypothetical protein
MNCVIELDIKKNVNLNKNKIFFEEKELLVEVLMNMQII